MRHRIAHRKLNKTASHRKAMYCQYVCEFNRARTNCYNFAKSQGIAPIC